MYVLVSRYTSISLYVIPSGLLSMASMASFESSKLVPVINIFSTPALRARFKTNARSSIMIVCVCVCVNLFVFSVKKNDITFVCLFSTVKTSKHRVSHISTNIYQPFFILVVVVATILLFFNLPINLIILRIKIKVEVKERAGIGFFSLEYTSIKAWPNHFLSVLNS